MPNPEQAQLETVTSSQDLQSLYDLGDEASQSTVLVEPKKKTPPRDPDSGQFVAQPANKFLVQAAKQLDISDEEIAQLDPQQLRQYIDDARRAQASQRRDGTIQGALDDAQQRAAAARQARFEQDELQRKQEEEKANVDPLAGIKEEDYTPEYRNVFTAIRNLHKEVNELRKWKENASQFLTAQSNEATASFARRIDHQLSTLGPEYEPFIGRGRGHKLPANSLERQVRNQLIQDAAALAGEGATKEDVIEQIQAAAQKRFGKLVGAPSEQEFEAAQRRYPPRQKKTNGVHPQFRIPRQEAEATGPDGELLTDEQVIWMNGGVRRPTNRLGAAEPKGKEKAINAVAQRQREWKDSGGGYEDGYETTPEDFLS